MIWTRWNGKEEQVAAAQQKKLILAPLSTQSEYVETIRNTTEV
jgi:hypothetical protein